MRLRREIGCSNNGEDTIPIAEIFPSISGEAGAQFQMGARCVFLRVSGCNIQCIWCDTEKTQDPLYGRMMPISAIVEKTKTIMEEAGTKNLVITGGEPLQYNDQIWQIIKELIHIRMNISVQVETNGSLPRDGLGLPPSSQPWLGLVVDYKTPSAQVPDYEPNEDLFKSLNEYDVVKIVVKDEADIKDAVAFLHKEWIQPKVYVCFSVENRKKLVDMAMASLHLLHRSNTGLNVQLHKILGLD